jgi:hypothetical protein
MNLISVALAFAFGIPSAASPTPSTGQVPTAAQKLPVLLPAPGPPKLLGSEILDGGFSSIDEGVLVAFGPQGRRYEVWEVHQGISIKHALVLAFDAAGTELWRSKYTWKPGEPWLGHLAATVDAAGDFYFMYITMPVGDLYRWRVAKVTADGVLAWDKTLYSTTWGQERSFLAPHPQGGIVVQSACDGAVRDMYTARLSSAGDLLWEKKLDFDGHNQTSAGVAVAADGSIYAVGQDESARVRKYTADGAIAWTASYERSTPYEHISARHAFLDRDGNLVVVGTTYAGGNDPDWYFVRKYSPGGARLRDFVVKIGKGVNLSDNGLQGVYATHAPDDSVYLAWDHDNRLDSDWSLARIHIPSDGAQRAVNLNLPALNRVDQPRVVWTKDFTGDAAMSVEELVWVPNGALGVLGRGKRMLQGYDYRYDTRLRAFMPDGVDLGMARFGSVGDFHNEPTAIAVSPAGIAYVLGWQYWSGDGWNDEDVMRLRFSVQK